MDKKITPGLYRHFRGKDYQVYGTATHAETGETMVIYRGMFAGMPVFVYPVDRFTERVDRNGYRGPRYMLIK